MRTELIAVALVAGPLPYGENFSGAAEPEDPFSDVAAESDDPFGAAPAPASPKRPKAAAPAKDEYHMQIERILEEDLWEIFLGLDQANRSVFRQSGEKAAVELKYWCWNTPIQLGGLRPHVPVFCVLPSGPRRGAACFLI